MLASRKIRSTGCPCTSRKKRGDMTEVSYEWQDSLILPAPHVSFHHLRGHGLKYVSFVLWLSRGVLPCVPPQSNNRRPLASPKQLVLEWKPIQHPFEAWRDSKPQRRKEHVFEVLDTLAKTSERAVRRGAQQGAFSEVRCTAQAGQELILLPFPALGTSGPSHCKTCLGPPVLRG